MLGIAANHGYEGQEAKANDQQQLRAAKDELALSVPSMVFISVAFQYVVCVTYFTAKTLRKTQTPRAIATQAASFTSTFQ